MTIKKLTCLLFFGMITFLLIGQSISLMSYNLRYDTDRDSLNAWTHRKAFLRNQVQFYSPDVMGTQEGLKHQLDYLAKGMTDYKYVGIGRDDGLEKGEYTAIFYNHQKFNLLQEGTFWLSQTPDTVGMGWDAVCNRTCTFVLLENKSNQQKFWVLNTHFDHIGKVARQQSAQLILEKIKTINKDNHPFVLMGDFNIEPSDPVYAQITQTLADAKLVSEEPPFGNEGTFNGFKFHERLTRRIDYIFVGKTNIKVLKYATLSDSKDCRYPSDHLPVVAEILLK